MLYNISMYKSNCKDMCLYLLSIVISVNLLCVSIPLNALNNSLLAPPGRVININEALNEDGLRGSKIGTPSTLLKEMSCRLISINNPLSSAELVALAKMSERNNSLRTIQRELHVLLKTGLIKKKKNKYYLTEWLLGYLFHASIDRLITDNPELTKPKPSEKEIAAVTKRLRTYDPEFVEEIMTKAWKKIAKIGPIEKIKSMDIFEFAEHLGAKAIRKKLPGYPGTFTIDKRTWRRISSGRKKLAAGKKLAGLSKASIAALRCEEIQGAGIYYNKSKFKDALEIYSTKTVFAHELFELFIGNAEIVDRSLFKLTGHFHKAVIESTMKFSLFMDEQKIFTRWFKNMESNIKTQAYFSSQNERSIYNSDVIRAKSMLANVWLDFIIYFKDFSKKRDIIWPTRSLGISH